MPFSHCRRWSIILVHFLVCSLFLPVWTITSGQHVLDPVRPNYPKPICKTPSFPSPTNLNEFRSMFDLSPEEEERLLTDGVLVLGDYKYENLGEVYTDWRDDDIPFIVTTDAWLHTFHVIHEDILKSIEVQHLIGLVETLVQELQNTSIQTHAGLPPTLPNVTAAVYENVVFFSVACRLLNDTWPVPGYASTDTNSYITKILDASSVEGYPSDDYTQYKPRGHYAGDLTLEAYFRCMKWLGRRIFQLNDVAHPLLTPLHIRQAVLFSEILRDNWIGALWTAIYNVTGRFAGHADSVTPTLVQHAIDTVFGPTFIPEMLESQSNITLLKEEFKKDRYPMPQIVPSQMPLTLKYCQLMGERWIPDGAAYQQTTHPHTPYRFMPTALESMYTMAGSKRALELIIEQPGVNPALEPKLRELRANVEANYSDADWQSCIYTNWLKILSTLVEPFDETYPTFMNTTAWLHEKLNTALGSYTQLRHDYILYVKQGGALGVPSASVIAEPIPKFYSELQNLISHLHTLLISTNLNTSKIDQLLEYLFDELNSYEIIAQKIIDEIPLTSLEEELVRDFGEGPGVYGNKAPMLVADIFTNYLSMEVLEEGVGPFNPLLVIHEPPGNNPLVYVGLVFSYYEFTQPISNRLTDQEWEALLLINPPDRPIWTESFLILEFEEILQQYDRQEKWQLSDQYLWEHFLDICFDGTDTFYLVACDFGYYSGTIYSFNTSTLDFHQISTIDTQGIEYWQDSLYGFFTNEIQKFDINGTLVASWELPTLSHIEDLTIDEVEGTIIVAVDSTPVFYEYSMEGSLLRTWGEYSSAPDGYYNINSVTADNGYLSIAAENPGLSIVRLSSTQRIATLSPLVNILCVRDFYRSQDGCLFFFDTCDENVYKLTDAGQILSCWTDIEENMDPEFLSMVPINRTHLALVLQETEETTTYPGDRTYHISIYRFNHSRPTRPLITPLNDFYASHSVTTTWTSSIDLDGVVTSYQYEIASSPQFFPLLDEGILLEPSLLIEWLDNDTLFFFRVRAQDNEGWNSTWSLVESSRILILDTQPPPTQPPPTSPPPTYPLMTILSTCIALVTILILLTGLTFLIGRKRVVDDK